MTHHTNRSEIKHEWPTHPHEISPHWCMGGAWRQPPPQNTKFWNINTCTGASLEWFYKIFRNSFFDSFVWGQLPNLGRFAQGVPEVWRFNLREFGYPQIFSIPSSKNTGQISKCFWSARTCSKSFTTMPSLVGLGLLFHTVRWITVLNSE